MQPPISYNLRCKCGLYITVYVPSDEYTAKVLHVQANRHDIKVERRPNDS